MTALSSDVAVRRPGASGGASLGAQAGRWVLALALPALVLGVLLYPDMHTATMSTALAAVLIVAGFAVLAVAGTGRWLILVPLAAGFLPSATAGFMAGAGALFLLVMFTGARRLGEPLREGDLALLACLGWACMAWLLNLGSETDLWSFPVSLLMFWTPWLLVFLLRGARATPTELRGLAAAWLALILVQLLPALVKPLATGTAGAYLVPLLLLELGGAHLPGHDAIAAAADITTGTMRSAHHLGVVAVLGAVFLLAWHWREPRPGRLLGAALLGLVVLMADAKHVLLSAGFVALPVSGVLLWREFAPGVRRLVVTAGIVLAAGGAALVGTTVLRLVRAGLWEPLVGVASFNPKVQLITRTAHLMQPGTLHTWVGYGPGAFASRAASSRATGALFKEETELPAFIPPFTPPAYAGVVYDLYTADIAETTRFRSGMLTNPFSSLVGIVAEYGVLGTLVVVIFLGVLVRCGLRAWRDADRPAEWRAFGAALAFGVPLLVVLSAFDSYFEQPDVVMPLALLWLLATRWPERS